MAKTQTEISWPFTKDPYGDLLYSPFGQFGARYLVPDESSRARITNNRRFAISGFTLSVMLLRMINSIVEANGLSRVQRVVADNNTCLLMLIPIVVATWFIIRQAKGLTVAVKRPSLRQACARLANSLELCVIWLAQGIAILLTVFAVFFFNDKHVVNRMIAQIQASTLFAFGFSVALFCCYLFSIRQSGRSSAVEHLVAESESSPLVSAAAAANIQCLANIADIGDDSRKWTTAELVKQARLNDRGT